MARGGKRAGAGRKPSVDPTVVMRIPTSKKEQVKQWLSENQFNLNERSSVKEALSILEQALTLKANAGGKIKTEIREAMAILQDQT